MLLTCQAIVLGACLMGTQLDHLTVSPSMTAINTALSYDKKERDVSRFYKNEDPQIKIGGSFVFNTLTKVSLSYNNGFDAPKYEITDSLKIGVKQIFPLNNKDHLIVEGDTTLGGKTKHIPCTDSYGRQYYCGNLTAWSDFRPSKHERDYNVKLTFTRRF